MQFSSRLLVPLFVGSSLLAAQACSSSASPAPSSDESEIDFLATSAREYVVTGSSTVTIEPELASAADDVKQARARELVALKNVAISWFLNVYLTNKEDEEPNKKYGGFQALTKFVSEDAGNVVAVDATTYRFDYRVEVAGQKALVDVLPGDAGPSGTKGFALVVGKPTNAELARLETNHEWYRKAPWKSFDPSTVPSDQLETIDLTIAAQKDSNDAFLAYDRLLADGEITIGVHFGWDYWERFDIKLSRQLYGWLLSHGFTSPVGRYEDYDRTSGPLSRTIVSNGKQAVVKVWLFHPGDAANQIPGPDPDTAEGGRTLEADMRESLAKREVVIYEGHSGSLYGFALANWRKTDEGDLDDSEIPTLELPKTYQIVLANGCDTYALGQAFWKNPAKSDHSNINVITTTDFSNAGTPRSAERLIDVLSNQRDGKLNAVRISELVAGLDGDQGYGFSSMFGVHGVDANPHADPTSDPSALCRSCKVDADCGADGNRCTVIASNVKACTTRCTDDAGCPAGYVCRPLKVATPGSAPDELCVPAARTCPPKNP